MVSGAQMINAPITHIPVFQKGGTIVPTWQRIRRSSQGMQEDPYTLYVALDGRNNANGSVYMDDGITHDYKQGQFILAQLQYNTLSATQSVFTSQPIKGGIYNAKNWVEKIVIRGLRSPSKSIIVRCKLKKV